ncbi:hypothetical protein [Paenibacillus arenilitoris]|uniref:Uncharacterized protein n=1 Tax=Paenibacillus arenilitoris TaxID=2772299 RepID=A0A927H7B9_9BACL|nr:hypothetical protein [Paenibacillus arenilitoris]MBD2871456.1 hypothetical protein [Paenibacillus arenilitoris]
MASEEEIKDMQESLRKLQAQVDDLSTGANRRRPGWVNFAIGFIVVFVVMFIGLGVFQFISAQ